MIIKIKSKNYINIRNTFNLFKSQVAFYIDDLIKGDGYNLTAKTFKLSKGYINNS